MVYANCVLMAKKQQMWHSLCGLRSCGVWINRAFLYTHTCAWVRLLQQQTLSARFSSHGMCAYNINSHRRLRDIVSFFFIGFVFFFRLVIIIFRVEIIFFPVGRDFANKFSALCCSNWPVVFFFILFASDVIRPEKEKINICESLMHKENQLKANKTRLQC